jgi:UDP:flavonoid glycosyltransferase YjiC (YdhE family)
MSSILAVTWNGGGNVPPLLHLAAELSRRGHDLRVLGHAEQRAQVERAGLRFEPFRRARPWSPTAPTSGVRLLTGYVGLFTDTGAGLDLEAELAREPADLLVVDALSLGVLRSARRSGVPTVVLVHLFHRYLTHRWARGPIGAIAALRGMRPGALWGAAARVLVASDPQLDPAGTRPRPGNVRYVGVMTPPARAAADRGGERPSVLVSLSTIFYPGQDAVLQAILDALDGLPVRAVVTAGEGVDRGSLRVPDGVEVVDHRPHAEVMPEASLVIGHGGHATTMFALAHDLPLLVLPLHPQLDQPMVGKAVADAGAGRVLPRTADAATIREAVVALLADGPHRRAAAEIGARLRAQDGAGVAADEVEALLSGASPVGGGPTGR